MKILLVAASALAIIAMAWFVIDSEQGPAVPDQPPSRNEPLQAGGKKPGVAFAATPLRPSAMFRDLLKTEAIGDYLGGNEEHWDFSPVGTVLAGFEISTLAGETGGVSLASLRAIFRGADGDRPGILNGRTVGAPSVIVAKPGYAVGAIEGVGTKEVTGIRVVFMRFDGTRLDAADVYRSDWLGGEGASKGRALDSESKPVVGVGMRCGAQVHSLTLFTRKDGANTAYPGLLTKAAADAALPLPRADAEECAVAVRGDDHFELFLNGVLVLTGDDWKTFYVRRLPLAPGDVLAAKVRDDQGGAKGGFYLEVSRGGAVILNVDRLKYTAAPRADWQTDPDVSSWSPPQITAAAVARAGEAKSKVAWSADAGKGTGVLFFKTVIP